MRIGILPNINKEKALEAVRKIADVKYNGVEFIVSEDVQKHLTGQYAFGDIKTCDVVITLGGDGTLLKASHQCAPNDIPILGINFGNLGFLTEGGENNLEDVIKRLVNGNYFIQERMMLEVRLVKDNNLTGKYFALNDVVLSRAGISKMSHVKAYVDGMLLDDYYADGIIISTPTGSTGYSFSAGGPIVEPEMKLMIITPICPHSLSSKPIIISEEKIISLQTSSQKESQNVLVIDGQINEDVEENVTVEILKANFVSKLVKFSSDKYYKTVREKLYKR